jgi:hypothetical protein
MKCLHNKINCFKCIKFKLFRKQMTEKQNGLCHYCFKSNIKVFLHDDLILCENCLNELFMEIEP